MKNIFQRTGKNSKFAYYLKSALRYLSPSFIYRRRLAAALRSVERRDDRDYIFDRVNYYNRLSPAALPPSDTINTLARHRLKGQKSVYFFDSYEYTRWFPRHLKWSFIAGDTNFIPPCPSVVKARPLKGDNTNSVLLNMDKVRHFIFLKDKKRFADKMNKVIFRGDTDSRPSRKVFVNTFHNHPLCDAGDVASIPHSHPAPKITLYQHLDYKFIISLEGNDVASNLKWVMSSNSVAVMPRPTCETWFMEGRLIPNYHYIEIKPDFSDFVERIEYYIAHPEEAEKIVEHAHEYVNQFRDKKRERLISLLVLQKYFERTLQI